MTLTGVRMAHPQMSCRTLEELHNVFLPADGRSANRKPFSLAHFCALRSLTLCNWMPVDFMLLSRLPASLEMLTLDAQPIDDDIIEPDDGCVHSRTRDKVISAGSSRDVKSGCTIVLRCRQSYPSSWSLTHLARLRELTLRGEWADIVMSGLLRSDATTVLPASLLVLRQQEDWMLCASAERRCNLFPLKQLTATSKMLKACMMNASPYALRPSVAASVITRARATQSRTRALFLGRMRPLAAVTPPRAGA